MTCRRVDRKCDGHTDTHTHTQVNLYSVHPLHSVGQAKIGSVRGIAHHRICRLQSLVEVLWSIYDGGMTKTIKRFHVLQLYL